MKKMAYLKAEGFNKGVPDIMCIIPYKGKKALLFIEMKRRELKPKKDGKGGVSAEQREWLDSLNECENVGAFVCYGSDEATELVKDLMKQTK